MNPAILLILLFYVPFFSIVTLFVARNFKNFDPEVQSISMLGSTRSKYSKVFNWAVFGLGLLLVLFAKTVTNFNPITQSLPQYSWVITLVGIIVMAIAVIPVLNVPSLHDLLGFVYMSLIACVGFIYLGLTKAHVFPSYFNLVVYAIFFFSIFLLWNVAKGYKLYKFAKVTWFFEWGVFCMYMALIFFTAFELLKVLFA